jgi:elongation factor G
MGIDSASGDTYAAEPKYCTLESMFVPEPVIKVAVSPESRGDADKLGKAWQRFRKEDPTFRVFTDEETGEIILAGMGELHLDIYVERIRREYKVGVEVGAPKVSYREAPTQWPSSSTTSTRSRRAVPASTPTSSAVRTAARRIPKSLRVREKVVGGRFPSSTSRRSKRASGTACTRARSPVPRGRR